MIRTDRLISESGASEGFDVVESQNSLLLIRKWRSLRTFGFVVTLVFVSALWLGTGAFLENAILRFIAICLTLYLLYDGFAELLNRTVISIHRSSFTVHYGPLPWKRHQTIDISDIKELSSGEGKYKGSLLGRTVLGRMPNRSYSIFGTDQQGRIRVLYSAEPSAQSGGLTRLQVEFVLNAVSAMTNIPSKKDPSTEEFQLRT
jgi:hypothetical protein